MPTLNHHQSLDIDYFDDGWDIYREKPFVKFVMFSHEEPLYPRKIMESMTLNDVSAVSMLEEVLQTNATKLSDRYNQVACNHYKEFFLSKFAEEDFSVTIGALFPDEKLPKFQGLYQGKHLVFAFLCILNILNVYFHV